MSEQQDDPKIDATILHSCDKGAIVRVHDWNRSWMFTQRGHLMPHCQLKSNGCGTFFCECKCSLCKY